MTSHDAQVAVGQGLGVLMLVPAVGIVVAVATSIAGRLKRRRTAPVPAFIPQQRTGGESGAR